MSFVNVGVKEVGGRVTRVDVSRKLKTAISLYLAHQMDMYTYGIQDHGNPFSVYITVVA